MSEVLERGSQAALADCQHRKVRAQIQARRLVDGPHGPILVTSGHTTDGSREWAASQDISERED